MEQPAGFFSLNHKRLLSIATWAKYLAWVVLIVYIFYSFSTYQQEEIYYGMNHGLGIQEPTFYEYLTTHLDYGFCVGIKLLGVFLKGIVYFLSLKGISLGLNMIVETDINRRDMREVENEQ
jgi:hypothetical protein